MLATLRTNIDRLGACASAICAVHCLLTGLLLGLLSVSGLAFLENELWDLAFIAIAVVLGSVAMVHGLRRHHSLAPALIFVFGTACVVSGHFWVKHVHQNLVPESFWTHNGHTVLMVLGGLSLVCFHTANRWLASHGGCGCEGCSTMKP